jgi:hypothetical protein
LTAVLGLYLAAVGSCVAALWSRGILRTKGKTEIYFFGHVANFKDGTELLCEVRQVYAAPLPPRLGWADEAILLARNTRQRRRLVNFAVFLSSVALLGTVFLCLVIYAS